MTNTDTYTDANGGVHFGNAPKDTEASTEPRLIDASALLEASRLLEQQAALLLKMTEEAVFVNDAKPLQLETQTPGEKGIKAEASPTVGTYHGKSGFSSTITPVALERELREILNDCFGITLSGNLIYEEDKAVVAARLETAKHIKEICPVTEGASVERLHYRIDTYLKELEGLQETK